MCKVNVEYDLTPAMVEGAIRNKLIEMGWTPPEPKQKIIDLSMMVGSDVDMEFDDTNTFCGESGIGKLTNLIEEDEAYQRNNSSYYVRCRIRQDHWHYWNGTECPLPEGLIATFRYIADDGCIEEARMSQYREMNWPAVIAFKILGTADGWKYEWE